MTETRVLLHADTSRAEAAMRELAGWLTRLSTTALWRYLEHQNRHHRVETPAASAMHAAYDRRRRARRRRR